VAAAALLAACDDKPKAKPDAGEIVDASPNPFAFDAAGIDAASLVQATPGCRLATPGGNALAGKLEPGSVTIAVVKGKALVVNTVYKDPRRLDASDAADALESAKAERVVLASSGVPEGPFEPVVEPHTQDEGPCCAETWAVATAFHDELTTLSYGTSRSAPDACRGGTLMLKGAGAPVWMLEKSCRHASVLAGAARGDLAVALLDGPTTLPHAVKTWPAVADAVVQTGGTGGKAKTLRLEQLGGGEGFLGRIEAPAAAVGKSMAAVAYRVVDATKNTRELHVARFDAKGEKIGSVLVLEKGNVGAPTLAFEGDALHVVWASRGSDREPYALRWSKIVGTAAPAPPQRLGTGITSAFAPSLAIEDGGRILIAWMEGDDKTGTIKVGASTRGIASAIALAYPVSNPGTNARDPEVGLDGSAMFLVWQELGPKTQELRAAALKCRE